MLLRAQAAKSKLVLRLEVLSACVDVPQLRAGLLNRVLFPLALCAQSRCLLLRTDNVCVDPCEFRLLVTEVLLSLDELQILFAELVPNAVLHDDDLLVLPPLLLARGGQIRPRLSRRANVPHKLL